MIELQAINGHFKREIALQAKYPMRILLVKEANGFLCMNSGDYPLKSEKYGRIFFIPEEGLVRLEGHVQSAHWISFSSFIYAEFLMQHLDPLAKNLFLNLSYRDLKDDADKTFSLFNQLKKHLDAQAEWPFLAQNMSLFLGFTAGLDGYLAAWTPDELDKVLRFKAILEQYFKSERSIQFYAEGMGLSPRGLNNFLAKVLGKSFSVLIRDRIMREAEQLLLHSDFSVDEIANMLGFTQTINFSSSFKRHKGVSVNQFSHLG